jgi:hypothetical protein
MPGRQLTGQEAARRFARARRDLEAAHRALAQAARPAKRRSYVFAGEWQRANAALERNRDRLTALPGVVGHGLGHRVKGGVETDEPCVVVFVREKRSLSDLKRGERIPKTLPHGQRRIATDVVRLGPLVPHAGPASVGVIGAGDPGTIGALGVDTATSRRVAITAMHLSGESQLDVARGDTPLDVASPSDEGRVGQLVLGTTIGIDAAKIVLDDGIALSAPLPILGSRPLSNDRGTAVRLFGAGSGQVREGTIKYLNVNLDDGGQSFVNALLASIYTIPGDSGAGLVDGSGYLLGFLFGLAPNDFGADLRVFSPAEAVLSFLRCTVP